MRLAHAFIQLPFAFDAARLQAEVAAFEAGDWLPHPEQQAGNWALLLIAVNGNEHDQGVAGPMRPTRHLLRSPYIQQLMAALDIPLGRARLMRLDGRAEAKPHVDLNYYWQQRVRIHIPVHTRPSVRFVAGDEAIHMAEGSCWIFDTWRSHQVINAADAERIHLVIDSVGSQSLWSAIRQTGIAPRPIAFAPHAPEPALRFETVNFPRVMPPGEIAELWHGWRNDALPEQDEANHALNEAFTLWLAAWREQWAQQGDQGSLAPYRALRDRLLPMLATQPAVALANGLTLAQALAQSLAPALLLDDAPRQAAIATSPSRIDRPIFIVAAPRSGSSMLFEALAASPSLASLPGESHHEIESIATFSPAARGYASNALTAADADDEASVRTLLGNFLVGMRHPDGRAPAGPVRFLEKTPKNALRIGFLARLFPDAYWVYLWRDPFESVGSLIDGWQSQRFVTYPDLPGWPSTQPGWSYLLIPGWQNLKTAPLADIATAQWECANRQILSDLAAIPADRKIALNYQSLLDAPGATLASLSRFLGIEPPPAAAQLPLSQHTLTPPAPGKWQRHEHAITPYRERLQAGRQHIEQQLAQWPAPAPKPALASQDYGSLHTDNLPLLLAQLGATLLISTYQAGKLVAAHAQGDKLHTHFLQFDRPMGIAAEGDQLFLGTQYAIREYRNVPDAARRMASPQPADAVYALRNLHITGSIDIHEMAIVDGRCLYVNTAFSCLCALDGEYSFNPIWRPRFVTGYSPEDRCHLNGFGLKDGQPAFLTALGTTDTHEGWRARKRDGGVLLDFDSGEIIAAGLSMPHSPRWHLGKLWVLESGKGSLGWVDVASGKVVTVAKLPGFTRGLAMMGPYAFIGMSQLREKGAFADIPLTDSQIDRACGVSVVHLETGQVVGFIKFSAAVQEIFALHLLEGVASPQFVDEHEPDMLGSIFALPEHALRDVRFTSAP